MPANSTFNNPPLPLGEGRGEGRQLRQRHGFFSRSAVRLLSTLCPAIAIFAAQVAQAGDELADRRLQIASLKPAEQEELLRKEERFSALPADEQERLRKLQSELDSDPKAPKLQQVLKRYHEWLKTLSPTQRAELGELSPEERVKRIKQIQQFQKIAHEQSRRADLLTPGDTREVVRWTESILWAHREALLERMPLSQRQKTEKLDEPKQRRALLLFMAYERGRRGGPGMLGSVESKDIDALAEKLSPAAQEALTKAADLSERRRIVGSWVGISTRRLETSLALRKLPPFVENELVQFFEKELKSPQRERLLKMPSDQMREELRRLYFESRERADGFFPGGPGGEFHDDFWSQDRKGRWSGRQPGGPDDSPRKSPDSLPEKPDSLPENDAQKPE